LNNGSELLASEVVVCASAWNSFLLPHLKGTLKAIAMQVFHFKPQTQSLIDSYSEREQFPVWAADIAKTGFYGFPSNAGYTY
jgi:glycine/D-amino acid oxidase-like deaminating enzyme